MVNNFYVIFQAEVRAHFNCSYLEGAELEDQGEDGTVLTHWEKRLFEVYYSMSIVSEICFVLEICVHKCVYMYLYVYEIKINKLRDLP